MINGVCSRYGHAQLQTAALLEELRLGCVGAHRSRPLQVESVVAGGLELQRRVRDVDN
eukprot:CAMPEP_0181230586 /NCGR_PEP_ID=MMETSP1096-20121128/34568_1 /TAXON_ID=156174 ORGANISM="Chrysochromulina ericina, Strain CCMP281" /NCGR_SAMPLE_ID=MMETSP1096 /ASSEMBLY_ACC=CAM_ASM_000453 /LENGTH=57 /DNA_ID=CAMNT_0023324403 /DNA_START=161 /DNA_END=334 /DNA_ORIENTATION=+